MNFLNRVVAKYQVRASDDEETFEMLNSWIFGDPEPLIESFNRGEWRPCGVAPKKLYRTIVLDNVNNPTQPFRYGWSLKEENIIFLSSD